MITVKPRSYTFAIAGNETIELSPTDAVLSYLKGCLHEWEAREHVMIACPEGDLLLRNSKVLKGLISDIENASVEIKSKGEAYAKS